MDFDYFFLCVNRWWSGLGQRTHSPSVQTIWSIDSFGRIERIKKKKKVNQTNKAAFVYRQFMNKYYIYYINSFSCAAIDCCCCSHPKKSAYSTRCVAYMRVLHCCYSNDVINYMCGGARIFFSVHSFPSETINTVRRCKLVASARPWLCYLRHFRWALLFGTDSPYFILMNECKTDMESWRGLMWG